LIMKLVSVGYEGCKSVGCANQYCGCMGRAQPNWAFILLLHPSVIAAIAFLLFSKSRSDPLYGHMKKFASHQ
jgi:hypothetical protein